MDGWIDRWMVSSHHTHAHAHAQLAYMKLELAGASVTVLALIVLIALFGLGNSRFLRVSIKTCLGLCTRVLWIPIGQMLVRLL